MLVKLLRMVRRGVGLFVPHYPLLERVEIGQALFFLGAAAVFPAAGAGSTPSGPRAGRQGVVGRGGYPVVTEDIC